MNLRRLLVGLFLIVSVPGLACLGWIGYANCPRSPNVGGAFPLRERWRLRLEGCSLLDPVSWNSIIYACLKDRIYAIRSQDGAILWQKHLPILVGRDEFFVVKYGTICMAETLITGVTTSRVLVLDAVTGEELWQVEDQHDGTVFCLAIGPDAIFVSRHYGLTAYDRSTGARLWRQEYIGPPVLAEGEIVYIFTDYAIAREAYNGDWIWAVPLGRVPSAAAIDEQRLYICMDGSWMALDVERGKVKWQVEKSVFLYTVAPPLLGSDFLCGGYWTSSVFALSKIDGHILWQTRGSVPVPLGPGNLVGSPVILDKTVYVRAGEDGRVYALSQDAGEGLGYLETYTYPPIRNRSIITAGGLLIIPVGDHELYAFGSSALSQR